MKDLRHFGDGLSMGGDISLVGICKTNLCSGFHCLILRENVFSRMTPGSGRGDTCAAGSRALREVQGSGFRVQG